MLLYQAFPHMSTDSLPSNVLCPSEGNPVDKRPATAIMVWLSLAEYCTGKAVAEKVVKRIGISGSYAEAGR